MLTLIKRLAVRYLPPPILFSFKKVYYTRAVQAFNEPDVEPIKRLVKPGDVVIDLGANIGWYSYVMSKLVGPAGRVYSVEPIPDTFHLLSTVTSRLALQNVELLNVAVSDKDGSAVMEIPLHEYGGDNFYMAKIVSAMDSSSSSINHVKVAVRSLDSLFLPIAHQVTFIKCDVEGHELAAIRGASKVFETKRPALMLEVAGQFENEGSPASELYSILMRYGYKAFIFDGQWLRERPVRHWAVNYFFLQPTHLHDLAELLQ